MHYYENYVLRQQCRFLRGSAKLNLNKGPLIRS